MLCVPMLKKQVTDYTFMIKRYVATYYTDLNTRHAISNWLS